MSLGCGNGRLPSHGGSGEKSPKPLPPLPPRQFKQLTALSVGLSVTVALVVKEMDAMLMLSVTSQPPLRLREGLG